MIFPQNELVQHRLFKSHKVWEKLAELEQAFGTYEVSLADASQLKIITSAYSLEIICKHGVFIQGFSFVAALLGVQLPAVHWLLAL